MSSGFHHVPDMEFVSVMGDCLKWRLYDGKRGKFQGFRGAKYYSRFSGLKFVFLKLYSKSEKK